MAKLVKNGQKIKILKITAYTLEMTMSWWCFEIFSPWRLVDSSKYSILRKII